MALFGYGSHESIVFYMFLHFGVQRLFGLFCLVVFLSFHGICWLFGGPAEMYYYHITYLFTHLFQ